MSLCVERFFKVITELVFKIATKHLGSLFHPSIVSSRRPLPPARKRPP
jgi:hypothetical protein